MIIFGTDQMDKFHEILLVQGIFHPRLQSYGSVDSDKNNLICHVRMAILANPCKMKIIHVHFGFNQISEQYSLDDGLKIPVRFDFLSTFIHNKLFNLENQY
jgi:hypothetical protein